MDENIIEVHEAVVEAINFRVVPEQFLAAGFAMENHVSTMTDYEYRGASGWRDWMNDVFELFAEGARYEVEELVAVGEDFVVALFCLGGRGAQSGLPLEFRWVGLSWFRNGKLLRAVAYANRRDALEAAGVSD